MMRRVGLFLFCALCLVSGFGQGLEREWVRTYALDKGRTNQAQFIALAPDGGVVVAGSSANGSGDLDYLVIKYGANGDEVWKQRHDSTVAAVGVDDQARGLAIDPAGNVFVTGTSQTVKFTAAGGFVWAAPFGGRDVVANLEFVYVTGFSELDFKTVQLDTADGEDLWTRTYDSGFSLPEISQRIALTQGGDVIVAGIAAYSCTPPPCQSTFSVLRYTQTGAQVWRTNLYSVTAGSNLQPRSIVIGSDGDIFLFARASSESDLYRLNPSGEIVWAYRDSSLTTGSQFIIAKTGEFYFSGYGVVVIDPREDSPTLTRVNPATGRRLWMQIYRTGLGGESQSSGVAADPTGNAFITGNSFRTSTDDDLFVVKYDPSGKQLAIDRYNSAHNGSDFGKAILADTNGNIYVTGYSTTAEGGTEVLTIKYSARGKIERQMNGAMRLEFNTAPGQKYALEATSDFFGWESLITNTADVNGVVLFEDTNATVIPYRFYRGKTAE